MALTGRKVGKIHILGFLPGYVQDAPYTPAAVLLTHAEVGFSLYLGLYCLWFGDDGNGSGYGVLARQNDSY